MAADSAATRSTKTHGKNIEKGHQNLEAGKAPVAIVAQIHQGKAVSEMAGEIANLQHTLYAAVKEAGWMGEFKKNIRLKKVGPPGVNKLYLQGLRQVERELKVYTDETVVGQSVDQLAIHEQLGDYPKAFSDAVYSGNADSRKTGIEKAGKLRQAAREPLTRSFKQKKGEEDVRERIEVMREEKTDDPLEGLVDNIDDADDKKKPVARGQPKSDAIAKAPSDTLETLPTQTKKLNGPAAMTMADFKHLKQAEKEALLAAVFEKRLLCKVIATLPLGVLVDACIVTPNFIATMFSRISGGNLADIIMASAGYVSAIPKNVGVEELLLYVQENTGEPL
nr:hypothetical protein B0A51_05011 [Rachicladosporium sp. CCFEE 5018]